MDERVEKASLVIMILFVIGILFYSFYLYNKEYILLDFEENKTMTTEERNITYNMTIIVKDKDTSQNIGAEYVIMQEASIQQKDVIEPNVAEIFSNAVYNVSYKVYADNDAYYLGSTECKNSPLENNDECIVYIKKTAKIYINGVSIKPGLYQLTIKGEDGVLKDSLLCLAYSNMSNVSISYLQRAEKPERVSTQYDQCYVPGTLEFSWYNYYVNYNTLGTANLSFILIDKGYNEQFQPTYEVDNEVPDIILENFQQVFI